MTTRWCPSCGKPWPSPREVCADCLADLDDAPPTTVHCPRCGHAWPSRMESCPDCLALLRPPTSVEDAGDDDLAAAIVSGLAAGRPLPRPSGRAAFQGGGDCDLLRLFARGPLVFTGPDGLLEANVSGMGDRAVAPLTCYDLDGSVLFELARYEAVDRGLVATEAGGAPLATFVQPDPLGSVLDVRDETSAPVARLEARGPGVFELVETGGAVVARCRVEERVLDGWVDDRWSLRVAAPAMPLRPIAAVALVLTAKVLFGREVPVVREPD